MKLTSAIPTAGISCAVIVTCSPVSVFSLGLCSCNEITDVGKTKHKILLSIDDVSCHENHFMGKVTFIS